MVEEYLPAMSLYKVVKFALGADNSLERTESLQMGLAHIGNQGVIGSGNRHQLGNIAGVAGAHLHDGYLVGIVKSQKGERHPDGVVEIALGGKHLETS